jgi:hypothetical protein
VKPVERSLFAVAIAISVSGAFFTPQLVIRSAPVEALSSPPAGIEPSLQSKDARQASGVHGEDEETPEGASGFTDLYGNEITDAIATYTFDRSGSLYELHSPQTEIPRLGSPKS